MILHDFTYEWDGKSNAGNPPISWWPGAYRVRIIRLGGKDEDIHYLFPVAVLLKSVKTGAVMNTSLKNYIHNFAEHLSKAYDLDIAKTLWVELRDKVRIAHLNPDRKLTEKTLFSFSWREARPNELDMIAPYIQDL
ncbi:MAG: hypothetical protein MI863_04305 [Desulfobacterales bacterium]|nr:hypothetical protein [Desulfobacterales bacterium]